MHSMNQINSCNGRGLHGTPDSCLPSQGASGYSADQTPPPVSPGLSGNALKTWEVPEQFLAPQKRQCPKACSPGKGRCAGSITAIQSSSLPCSQETNSWAEFSLCPEKSHHSKLLQNPSKSASFYLSCWLAVVAHHSKLKFNNLGVEQMGFPLCFYPECYQRETDNTISGIQSCPWKW